MKTIGLLSDTHGYLHPHIFKHFKDCDEVWHAGDIGSENTVRELQQFKPLRAVYGNIDGLEIRKEFPEINIFYCEKVKVMMKHIGGYPKKYAPGVKEQIVREQPKLFISGHSHILKIVYDHELACLHINPGACGLYGWHRVKTLVKFSINEDNIQDCKIIELHG
jgi:putative phosphoesterase